MRIRSIKPEFWTHPVMARQSDQTKLLALGLLNYADDEGYFYAEAAMIRAALRPLDEDSKIVRRSLEELVKIGFVEVVEHPTHGPLGKIVNFTSHQRVDRPNPSKIRELWGSTNVRRKLDDDSSPEGSREQGAGNGARKGKDSFCAESAEPTSAPPPEPILIFPCVGPVKEWPLTLDKLTEWQDGYPDMDALACVKEARLWCLNNPTRRKTATGMTRFLGGWLSRAQNKGEHRRIGETSEIAYWTPTDPNAFRPQEDALAEAFREHHGDNPLAAGILEKLNAP